MVSFLANIILAWEILVRPVWSCKRKSLYVIFPKWKTIFSKIRAWMTRCIVQSGQRTTGVLSQLTLCSWCAGKVVRIADHVLIKTHPVNFGRLIIIVIKTQGTCGSTVKSAATYVSQVSHGLYCFVLPKTYCLHCDMIRCHEASHQVPTIATIPSSSLPSWLPSSSSQLLSSLIICDYHRNHIND